MFERHAHCFAILSVAGGRHRIAFTSNARLGVAAVLESGGTAMREQQDGDVEDRYRHVRHHPVFGGRGPAGEGMRPVRAGAGPRPSRPVSVPVSRRPVAPRRPEQAAGARPALRVVPPAVPVTDACRRSGETAGGVGYERDVHGADAPAAGRPAPRVLPRRTAVAAPGRRRFLLRRIVAGAALVVVAALAVAGLGLLADAASAARQPAAPAPVPAPVVVTVDVPGTVWDLAGRVDPAAGPAERAELAGRIVAVNALPSAQVRPGQRLVVPVR
jgi:hypothetical protein